MTKAGELLKKIDDRTIGMKEAVDELQTWRKQEDERMNGVREALKNMKPGTVSLPGVNEGKDKGKFSFVRAALMTATKDWDNPAFGFERDIMKETQKRYEGRALSGQVDSAGGFVIPAQYIAEIIEQLKAESTVIRAGARQLTGLVGSPVEIPKKTGAATVASNAENSAITFSDQTFGQVTLSPKMLSAGTKLSRRSAALSNPSLEQLVRADLAEELALKMDILALRGTGASNEPVGIANQSGIGSVVAGAPDGGPITDDLLVDMEGALEDANALRGRLGFIFHPKVRRKIVKLKDNENLPLFRRDPSEAQARTLLGYPFFTTTQIPTNLTKGSGTNLSEIYFANWDELLIGMWGDMILEASMEAGDSTGGAFSSHQIWMKAVQDWDTAVRHAESFVLMNDVETA